MIKTEIKIEQREVEMITEIICNLCGKSIPKVEVLNQYEFATLSVGWGYGSGHDGDSFQLHFCESCVYQKLLPQLTLQPEVFEH